MSEQLTAYRADWVLPVGQPPVPDGVVVVGENEIKDVMPSSSNTLPIIDLGRAAIIPGLVNAHTHLEFSDLEAPLGQPGIEFTEWISKVVQHRAGQHPAVSKQFAIQRGLIELIESGVVAVGEIASTPVELGDYQVSGIDVQVFHELLGPNTSDNPRLAGCQTFLSSPSPGISKGLSPHAPYSVSSKLMNHAVKLANAHGLPIAMHLAETPQERELLEHQSGPFVGLLQHLGTWDPNDFGEDRQTWHYLERLSQISRGLLIHGNYLTDKELDWISQQAGLHVVYCPRTHRFFEHASYPLQAMLDRSINVAVGTDSRASNPNLNLFEELKFISSQFNDLDPMQVLRLGTLNGASALGMEQRFGTLEKGKSSRLAVIRSHEPAPVNVSGSLDWLFSQHSTCHPLGSEHPSH